MFHHVRFKCDQLTYVCLSCSSNSLISHENSYVTWTSSFETSYSALHRKFKNHSCTYILSTLNFHGFTFDAHSVYLHRVLNRKYGS